MKEKIYEQLENAVEGGRSMALPPWDINDSPIDSYKKVLFLHKSFYI